MRLKFLLGALALLLVTGELAVTAPPQGAERAAAQVHHLVHLQLAPPSVKLPAEVQIPLYRLASIPIEYDGEDVKWVTFGEVDTFREYDPDPRKVRLRLIGYQAGKYQLVAVACRAGKMSEFATCTITVGDPPPPPPPPPPAPPNDPLYPQLQAALVSEGGTKAQAAALAVVLRQCAMDLKNSGPAFKTAKDFLDHEAVVRKAALGEAIPRTRAVLGAEWNKFLPRDPATAMTAALAQQITDAYGRAASLLEYLAK